MKAAKQKAELLAESVKLLANDAKELASLAHMATNEEYRLIKEAEQAYFTLSRLIGRALANIKGRIEDNSAEGVRKFLEEI